MVSLPSEGRGSNLLGCAISLLIVPTMPRSTYSYSSLFGALPFVRICGVINEIAAFFKQKNPCLLCLGGTQLAGAFRLEKDATLVREEMNKLSRLF